MNNFITIESENPHISDIFGNVSSENLKVYYLLQVEGDPKFRLTADSARKNGVKAEFIPAGWVYDNKEHAEDIAKRWTQGKRKIRVVPWYDSRLDMIWKGTKKEKRLARKLIQQELDSDRINKERETIKSKCHLSPLHHSWLHEDDISKLQKAGCSREEIQAYEYFKPLWDKTFEEEEETDLRAADLAREEEDFDSQAIAYKPIFKPYSFFDLMCMPPKIWLMDQVFGSSEIGMIYGSPGCGKSFIAIDMIIALCSGGLWANRFNVNCELNVAYCAGEGISGLPARFSAAAKYHNISSLHNFTFYTTIPQLYEDGSSVEVTIKQFIHEWKARQHIKETGALDVLIIDTLHTATVGADENAAKDAGKVIHSCRLAANELGCTVILVHHTDKNGLRERGSSAYRAAMDFMIGINKSEGGKNATMYCEKLKDGEKWQDQDFQLSPIEECKSVHVLWNEVKNGVPLSNSKAVDKQVILNEMKSHPGKRFTCKSLSEVIAKKDNYTNALLIELLESNKCARESKNPDKDPSSWNPWVYFIEDFINEK